MQCENGGSMDHRRTYRAGGRALVGLGAALAVLVGAAPSFAHPRVAFAETDLVGDQAGVITDAAVVNTWGLASSPTGPLWVANNGTNTATVYTTGGPGPITKAPLTVSIPGGAPTGQAFNSTDGFVVTGPNGSGPARFLFVSEDGDLTGWSPAADPTNAIVAGHVDGAVYKGLALWANPFGSFLIATDFAHARLDVFDSAFHRLNLPSQSFHDPDLPAGYAPFNVLADGDTAYVTYAKQQAGSDDEQAGPGLGIVDTFTHLGQHVSRIASHGSLNAPWGLAIAPASFGHLAGDLLVGNFGDGRIGAYEGKEFEGFLRDNRGRAIRIDGLWALLPGTAAAGGTGSLWFSAGPGDEEHGLIGLITPASP
jgi:uncharacterized protein (TIGR03118 family)